MAFPTKLKAAGDAFATILAKHRLAFCVLWATGISVEYFVFGADSLLRVHDNGDGFVPAKIGLTIGGFGRWQPMWLCGVDHLGQAMTTELDTLLLHLAPPWMAYAGLMWAQRFVAAYFMLRLTADELGLRPATQWFAALSYSAFVQPAINGDSIGFNLCDGLFLPGLPLVLWSIPRLSRLDTRSRVLGIIGLGVLLAFSSMVMLSLFIIPLLIPWFTLITPPNREQRKSLFWVLVALVGVWFALELPTVVASMMALVDSHRIAVKLSQGVSFSGAREQTALLLRANAVALVFVPLALIKRRLDSRLLALVVMAVACAGIVAASPWIQHWLREHARPLSALQVQRVSMVAPFLFIVTGAMALDRISTLVPRIAWPVLSGALILVLLTAASAGAEALARIAAGEQFRRNLVDPLLTTLRAQTKSEPPFRVATVGGTRGDDLHPAAAWAHGFETVDGYVNLYPQRYKELWSAVNAGAFAANPSMRDYFESWGNRVYLFPPSEGDPSDSVLEVERFYNQRLLSLANVRFIFSTRPLDHPSLTLMSQRRTERSASTVDRLRSSLRSPSLRTLYVYENRDVLPRFFLAKNTVTKATANEVIRAMEGASREELATTAFLESRFSVELRKQDSPAEPSLVRMVRYSPDCIRLDVDARTDQVLVITNNYSKEWSASLDDRSTALFPVDHAFQGVLIPSGRHRVALRYSPPFAFARDCR